MESTVNNTMNIMSFLGAAFTIVLVSGALYIAFKHRNRVKIEEETIDNELRFDDIYSYFKIQSLQKEKHIPFIASGECERINSMLHLSHSIEKKGYISVFIGVYNEQNDTLVNAKLIYAKSIDEKTKNILGTNELVVLN